MYSSILKGRPFQVSLASVNQSLEMAPDRGLFPALSGNGSGPWAAAML